MSEPIVLVSYLPGEGLCFKSERYEVRPIRCEDEFSYWAGLNEWWDSDCTVINVEHDIELTDEVIDGLLACEHPLCAQQYQCHRASSGLWFDVFPAQNQGWFVTEGTEWAEQSAIGALKICPEARIAPLEKIRWGFLEVSIENAVKRPVHCHWNPILAHWHF